MTTFFRSVLAMVSACALAFSFAARAADDPDTEEAKKLYKVATGNYDLGRYEEALEEYEDAYAKKPLPAFFFNIALCHRKLGHHKEAAVYFEKFLAEEPKAKNRDDAESMLAEEKVAALNEPPPLAQEPPPPPKPAPPPPAPAPAPPEDATWVWVASGVAAAAVVAGTVALVAILAQPPQPVAVVDLRGAS